jgi:hypothetical protein
LLTVDRVLGVLALRPSVYREIAEDPNAIRPAGFIVAAVALVSGLVLGLERLAVSPEGLTPTYTTVLLIGVLVSSLLFNILSWIVESWILAFVSKWFGGRTNIREMLRVTGFVELFGLVIILGLVGVWLPALAWLVSVVSLVVLILQLIGFIVGIREAAEFSTGNAIITAIFAAIVSALIGLATVFVSDLIAGALPAFLGST